MLQLAQQDLLPQKPRGGGDGDGDGEAREGWEGAAGWEGGTCEVFTVVMARF